MSATADALAENQPKIQSQMRPSKAKQTDSGVRINLPLCCSLGLESLSDESSCDNVFQSLLLRMIKDLEHVYVSTSRNREKTQLATKGNWKLWNNNRRSNAHESLISIAFQPTFPSFRVQCLYAFLFAWCCRKHTQLKQEIPWRVQWIEGSEIWYRRFGSVCGGSSMLCQYQP